MKEEKQEHGRDGFPSGDEAKQARRCGCDAKRNSIPDRDTTGRARAQGGRLRAVLSIAGPARRRLRHGPLPLTFSTGLCCPACSRALQAFESLPPLVEARRSRKWARPTRLLHKSRFRRAVRAAVSRSLG